MKIKINANQFLECSAKNYENINEVIYEAVRASAAGIPEVEPQNQCMECLASLSCCMFLFMD